VTFDRGIWHTDYYFAVPAGERSIVISLSVSMSLTLPVCMHITVAYHATKLHQIICACYPRSWLSVHYSLWGCDNLSTSGFADNRK